MHPSLRSWFSGRLLSFAACVIAGSTYTRAQTAPLNADAVPLQSLVVSASRTPQDPKLVANSVEVLPLSDLAATQVFDLRTALAETPGVIVVNTGAVGGQTSLFIRGANSDQTLFFVDGVRMNDRNALYSNFLAGADLTGLDRVEVLKGPQSTLYGSSAMGGVVLIETTRGCGTPTGDLAATAGSFGTLGASTNVQGGTAHLGYSGSVGYFQTNNVRPNNEDRQWNYSARLEQTLGDQWLVGATVRGVEGKYDEPGSVGSNFPGKVTSDTNLATAYAEWRLSSDFRSRLTGAWHGRDYRFAYAYGVSNLRNRREIVDWQNTWEASPQVELVGGVNAERSRYTVDGVHTDDDSHGVYLSATEKPLKNVSLTEGLRYDYYHSAGGATTGRLGAAWNLGATKFRTSYGTGFNAPGSDDRFGVPEFGQLANPALKPEKVRGGDVGIDQDLWSGRATVSATYFENKYKNLFDYQYVDYVTYSGKTVNRARATTDGVELAAVVKWPAGLQSRIAYTYLEARNDSDATRLIRRPRHTLDADTHAAFGPGWMIGAGVHAVADRADGFGAPHRIEDYTTARLYASYEVVKGVLLKVRVENALDERYQEVLGYPALPREIFGSVEWRF